MKKLVRTGEYKKVYVRSVGVATEGLNFGSSHYEYQAGYLPKLKTSQSADLYWSNLGITTNYVAVPNRTIEFTSPTVYLYDTYALSYDDNNIETLAMSASIMPVAYFDEDISSELIEKQDKKDNINYKSINVKQFFKDENNKKIELNNIKTYIQLRKKIEEALKGEEVLLYIDYNNHYSFLDEQIKEIAKIQKVRLSIILCEPFSIENAKKINYIKEIEKVYEDYNIYKVDCSLSEQKNIALNQIFEKRQEMLISKIDEIAKKIKSDK